MEQTGVSGRPHIDAERTGIIDDQVAPRSKADLGLGAKRGGNLEGGPS
jgi:hypothetical protein